VGRFRVIDADGHVFEPDSLWARHLPQGPRAVTALCLQVSEKLDQKRRVELLERQCRRRYTKALRREGEEQLERVCVGIDGVLAGLTLLRQSLAEVGGQMRGEWCHDRPPVTKASCTRSAMSRISRGVACRYQ
jgi:hypothetical protein